MSTRSNGSGIADVESLRKENKRLKEDINYLNKKCEELMSGQNNDDAMVALLKNKINALEMLNEENEKDHELQIHNFKKKYQELQRESNSLRQTIKEMEHMGIGNNESTRVEILEKRIAEKEENLRIANVHVRDLQMRVNELLNIEVENSYEINSNSSSQAGRRIIRKRPTRLPSRGESIEGNRVEVDERKVHMTQGEEELKKMLMQVLDEKGRLEKINTELTNKIMVLMKTFETEKAEELRKEKKKFEAQSLAIRKELDETKRQKEDNEKNLLSKIFGLEKKLNEREDQMKLLGSGIESLKNELNLRDDPSHSSTEVIKYLEKFAKYQNQFLKHEVVRFQEDFTKLKLDVRKREDEGSDLKNKNISLNHEFQKVRNELELKTEILALKTEETKNLKQENNNLVIAMELLRREKVQVNNIKKANNELNNQLIHYKGLVRRMVSVNNSSNGTVSLKADTSMQLAPGNGTGKEEGRQIEKVNTSNNVNLAIEPNIYGFKELKMQYEEANTDSIRIQAVQKVLLDHLDQW